MNALWGLLKMLLKVEKTMSGLKVCKGESMKAPESKGMIRESYKHLASLEEFFFFKIFAPINMGSGAFNLPSTVEELPFSHLGIRFLRLRELGYTAATKQGTDARSVSSFGTRNSVSVQIQRRVAYSDSDTACKGSDRRLVGWSGFGLLGVRRRLCVLRGCSSTVTLRRVNLFPSG